MVPKACVLRWPASVKFRTPTKKADVKKTLVLIDRDCIFYFIVMKLCLFIGSLNIVWALNAHAVTASPLQQGDTPVSSKFYNTGNASMPIVPMKIWSGTDAPQTQKEADTKMAPLRGQPDAAVFERANAPSPARRQSNFTGRRADADGRQYQSKSAPINPRQIRANTPAGTEELKKQLNTLQWTTPR
jgi:hypothetical protein